MSKTKNKPHPALPLPLKGKLSAYRVRLWQMKIAEAVMAGIFGLLFSYLIVFILDRFIETSGLIRLVILISGISLFAFFVPIWLRRWVWGHRNEVQLARLIAKKHPRFGDRLLGVVELQEQGDSDATASPVLKEAALRAVTKEIEKRDLSEALPISHYRRWSIIVLLLFVGVTAALVTMPEAGMNAMKRWILPLSNTPRFTFAQIEGLPETLVVPYGESYKLTALLKGGSTTTPPVGTAKIDRLPIIRAELDERSYHFQLPGLQTATSMTISIGDIRKKIQIEPVIRPSIEHFEASIDLPAYLKLPPTTTDIRTGVLTVLEGSTFTLKGKTTRKLKEVHLQNSPKEKLRIEGDQFSTPKLSVPNESKEFVFHWEDIHGLTPSSSYNLSVEPIQDGIPSAYIQGIGRQHVMLAKETVEFEVAAEDDFGIKEFGIEWLSASSQTGDASATTGDVRLAIGEPGKLRLGSPAAFSPATVGIEPQKLYVRAYVEDFHPDRGRIYSEPITLFILTLDEHAQMLKEKFDRIIGELEDVARTEETNFEENKRIDQLDSQKLNSPETKDRLKEQTDLENENIEILKKLNSRMENLFKDAVRNGGINKETLRKMAQSMNSLDELASKDLPEVSENLESSSQEQNSTQETSEKLGNALKNQEQAIEKMRKAIAEANEANNRFEASTFVNRVRNASKEERSIAKMLIGELDNLIGFNVVALDPKEQRTIKEISQRQRQNNSVIRWIEEDLIHYLNRTSKPELETLLSKLKSSRINDGLNELNTRISANETVQSIHGANHWADQLNAWAKEASGASKKGGGAGGGGAGSGSEQDFEFNLRIMKMIQTEQDLRARTRALEQLKRSSKSPSQNPPA